MHSTRPEPEPEEARTAPSRPPRRPLTLPQLSRRITTWATNLLMTGVVLVAALGFGRQVLVWWRADDGSAAARSPAGPAADPAALGSPMAEHALRFGQTRWVMRRREVAGPRAVAEEALVAVCRQGVEGATPTTDTPGEAEKLLLAWLSPRDPVAEEPGRWQVHRVDDDLLMAAGVRELPRSAGPDGGQPVAEGGRRVVTWAVAVPSASQGWTVYSFQQAGAAPGGPSASSETPLPPESRRILSMRVAGGGEMTAFRGPFRPETWMQFYDQWFRNEGWTSALGWLKSDAAWSARFSRPEEGSIDVRFGTDRHGGLSGLLIRSPGAASSHEGDRL